MVCILRLTLGPSSRRACTPVCYFVVSGGSALPQHQLPDPCIRTRPKTCFPGLTGVEVAQERLGVRKLSMNPKPRQPAPLRAGTSKLGKLNLQSLFKNQNARIPDFRRSHLRRPGLHDQDLPPLLARLPGPRSATRLNACQSETWRAACAPQWPHMSDSVFGCDCHVRMLLAEV